MQIPPLKKSTFWLVVAASVLVGIIIGSILITYSFVKNKAVLCPLLNQVGQPPKINTNLTPRQIQGATSIAINRTIFGKVVSKNSAGIVIEIIVVNLLDRKNSTTTTMNVPFDAQRDEILVPKLGSGTATSSTAQMIKASLNDIKIGQQVLIKILDGKKTIYLIPTQ